MPELLTLPLQAFTTGCALCLALLIDRYCGEPPVRLHPVVWMGYWLHWAGQRVLRITLPAGHTDFKSFWLAALYWCAGAALFSGVAWVLQAALTGLWFGLSVLLMALLLKPLLAWAMLHNEVQAVEAALAQSLDAGRERLSWLVSRDVSALSQAQVRESAIESLAENLNDSVVAPIFWFVLWGLPGVALYRFANTADAMWGYRGVYKGQNWEWAGKWAARADDVLNWLPARLTGLLLALCLGVSLHPLRLQAQRTPSPNSGWPMAAMALALNVRLGKPGVYTLNAEGHEAQAEHVARALVYASKVLLVLIPLALVALYFVAFMGFGNT